MEYESDHHLFLSTENNDGNSQRDTDVIFYLGMDLYRVNKYFVDPGVDDSETGGHGSHGVPNQDTTMAPGGHDGHKPGAVTIEPPGHHGGHDQGTTITPGGHDGHEPGGHMRTTSTSQSPGNHDGHRPGVVTKPSDHHGGHNQGTTMSPGGHDGHNAGGHMGQPNSTQASGNHDGHLPDAVTTKPSGHHGGHDQGTEKPTMHNTTSKDDHMGHDGVGYSSPAPGGHDNTGGHNTGGHGGTGGHGTGGNKDPHAGHATHYLYTAQINHQSFTTTSRPPLTQYDEISKNEFCEIPANSTDTYPKHCKHKYCSCTQIINVDLGQVSEKVFSTKIQHNILANWLGWFISIASLRFQKVEYHQKTSKVILKILH